MYIWCLYTVDGGDSDTCVGTVAGLEENRVVNGKFSLNDIVKCRLFYI